LNSLQEARYGSAQNEQQHSATVRM
jgi:hypothetical protein